MLSTTKSATNAINKACTCPTHAMQPERVSFDLDKYTHTCLHCSGGISHSRSIEYDHFWGYSGFDEYNDEVTERIDDER